MRKWVFVGAGREIVLGLAQKYSSISSYHHHRPTPGRKEGGWNECVGWMVGSSRLLMFVPQIETECELL